MKKLNLILAFLALSTLSLQAQISVTPSSDAFDLATTLIGTESGITIVSATYTGEDGGAGTFADGEFGISQGILLTSGLATTASGPNDVTSATNNVGQPGDADLDEIAAPFGTNDAAILEIELTPTGTVLEFTYVFGSEEYNEYVCSSFNDVFAFFVSGGIYENQNIAILPGTDPPVPVSINNVNNGSVGSNGSDANCDDTQLANSEFFVDNSGGENIQYDGYTVPLIASIVVVPGTTYTLRLAIADAGDGSLDSGVFIEAGSIVSVNCDAGAISYEQFDALGLAFCVDQLPSSVSVSNNGMGQNDDYQYVVVDADGIIVALSEGNNINTGDLAVGEYEIYGISYAGAIVGLLVGADFDEIAADGCLDISNSLTIDVFEDCEEFDCPVLEANNGDACETEDGEGVLVDCECQVEILFDCPQLEANNGDACETEDGEGVLVDCECQVEILFDCPELEANNGDACETEDGEGVLVDCECQVEILFDCPQLEANNGDACETEDGEGVLVDCECQVEILFDCPDLMANFGDACMVAGEEGTITADCQCQPELVTGDCTNFVYYLSDVADNDASDIYKIELDALTLEANLTLLKQLDYQVHIAYNETDGLLYLVNSSNGAFRSLDVSVTDGAMSAETALSTPFTKAIAAAFNLEGDLIIADQNSNEIVSVDILTGIRTPYATGNVSGGDVAFGPDGLPYLATRSGNLLYQINPGMANSILGNVPSLVTGMVVMSDGNLLFSSKNAGQLTGRNNDGSNNSVAFDLRLDGNPFISNNGDMASGCSDNQQFEACNNFRYLYSASNTPGVSQGTVFEGTITGGDFVLTEIFSPNVSSHIAMNTDNGDIYVIQGTGNALRTYDATGTLLNTVPLSLSQTFAAVWNPADGLVYIGSANQNKVYAVNPVDGSSALFASNVPVDGGDLVLNDEGDLFLVERRSGASKLFNISTGVPVLVSNVAPEVNGAAITSDGLGFIMAEGEGSSTFHIYDAAGTPILTLNAVDAEGNPFLLFDGDMASGCMDNSPVITIPGECYASQVLDFNQGLKMNGDAIGADRSDPTKALGAPDQSNAAGGFVSLGVGGYITLGFDGAITDGPGNDILIFETSFTGNVCGQSDDESADIAVSQDGIVFVNLGTICRDGGLDISTSGLDFVTQVRITNSAITGTADGYDVDGIVAVYNCEITEDATANLQSTITSYPNPTNGQSQVVFATAKASRTTVDVYDMNGRRVVTLFNQMTNEGQEYRLDFNATDLPNGVYIYRMTTNSETIISKFMLSK